MVVLRPYTVIFQYADSAESRPASGSELDEIANAARFGQIAPGVEEIEVVAIPTGERATFEMRDGYCAHSRYSLVFGAGAVCEFCNETIRPLSADEYRGMVE